MRILTIFTGGTIGSSVGADGRIATEEKTKYLLLQQYEEKYEKPHEELHEGLYGDKVVFDTLEPYRILSENLKGEYLERLVHVLAEVMKKDYDGVIITHGTDTLQYTAAALQYLFADVKIPVVLVSAAYVLTDSRTNGIVNFAAAVEFIKGRYGTGVFVSYCNEKDVPKIHRGNRLQNALAFSADISSICEGEYGSFSGIDFSGEASLSRSFIYNERYRQRLQEKSKPATKNVIKYVTKSAHAAEGLPISRDRVKFDREAEILRLRAYPGMTYPQVKSDIQAVLYESYHSGTICIDEELKAFAMQMKERRIPIFVTGLNASEAEYETVEMFRKLGLIAIENKAPIAQYMKLWIANSNGLDVMKTMQQAYGEE